MQNTSDVKLIEKIDSSLEKRIKDENPSLAQGATPMVKLLDFNSSVHAKLEFMNYDAPLN